MAGHCTAPGIRREDAIEPCDYHSDMTDVTAFVLAGGRGLRMGTDKAFIEFGETTLLARALAIASAVGPVRIVGNQQNLENYGSVVHDIFTGQGPLAGIHAALRSSETDLNVVLAVDMPFVRPEFLNLLVRRARESSTLVTVPRIRRQFQPLCAVYRCGFADLAEVALQQRKNKIDPLFVAETTDIVDETEVEDLAFSPAMFDNLNTTEDLRRVRLWMQESR